MADETRVLVVQAEPSERAFQRSLFAEAGMSVVEACSGSEALDYLATDHPDLVVLGRMLPDMDGLDLLPRLKSSELDFLPVLVASHRSETAEGFQLVEDLQIVRKRKMIVRAENMGCFLGLLKPDGAGSGCGVLHAPAGAVRYAKIVDLVASPFQQQERPRHIELNVVGMCGDGDG